MAGPAQYQEALLKIAGEACQKLFAHYGFPLRPATPGEPNAAALVFHGVIGFSGKAIRGRLILGSSSEPLERSNPAQNVPIREWMGELSNQLLGRIKNQLLLYKVDLNVSTPLILRDTHMAELQSATIASLALRGSAGLVQVWLDLSFGKGFQMADHPDPSLAGPVESDTLFL